MSHFTNWSAEDYSQYILPAGGVIDIVMVGDDDHEDDDVIIMMT